MKKISYLAAAAVLAVGAFAAPTLKASAEDTAKKTNTDYVAARTVGSGLAIEPTLICEPKSFAQLEGCKDNGITSVVLTPTAQMDIMLSDGADSLANVFDDYLNGVHVPVLRLTGKTVGAFCDWIKAEYRISDMMVITSEKAVLEKLDKNEYCRSVNTVYDLTDKEIGTNRYDLFGDLGDANELGCNILMYDAGQENLSVAAEYVSAMTKVCWAKADSEEEAVKAIAAGCMGVLSEKDGDLKTAIGYFTENGFARAQHIAAHRGITKYANENSLTAIAASANEGATHVEIDLQVTSDGDIRISHDSQTNRTGSVSGWYFSKTPTDKFNKVTLEDYSRKYGDKYPTLDEVVRLARKTDLILILELKMDDGSTAAADEIKAIESLKRIMSRYPDMDGHWITITFFSPYAEGMRELLPRVPVGFLGGGMSGREKDQGLPAWGGGWTAMTNVAAKISFLHKYGMVLDETYETTTNTLAQTYLARGYTQNTWTFENTSHFSSKANIATTNAAEACSMLIKEIPAKGLSVTEAQLSEGKISVDCLTYCGRKLNQECKIIPISRSGNECKAILYCNDGVKGQYSELVSLAVK